MPSAGELCQLWLTCANTVEADTITQTLLDKKLVVCVKQSTVNSDYLWEGVKEHNDEVLLIMDSRTDLFDKVESEVAKLHSYDTFVLIALPILRISRAAQSWVGEEL